MREIKFRAWDGKNIFIPFSLKDNILTEEEDFSQEFETNDYLLAFPSKTIFMQFTGLKDKNGKEIYEGDILRRIEKIWNGRSHDYVDLLFQIIFKESSFVMKRIKSGKKTNLGIVLRFDSLLTESQVIGNIYENPKLLEEKK